MASFHLETDSLSNLIGKKIKSKSKEGKNKPLSRNKKSYVMPMPKLRPCNISIYALLFPWAPEGEWKYIQQGLSD